MFRRIIRQGRRKARCCLEWVAGDNLPSPAACHAYGLTAFDRMQLPDAIVARQVRNVRFWSERLELPGSTPTSPTKIVEIIEWSEREARFVGEHHAQFMAALA